jgi:hypothetical protein
MPAEHILHLTRPDGKPAIVFVGQIVTIEPALPGEGAKKANSRLSFSNGKEHFFADTFEKIVKQLG